MLTKEEHIERHEELHEMLDELVADYIKYTGNGLSSSTIMELITWSSEQMVTPTEGEPVLPSFIECKLKGIKCNLDTN